MPRPRNAVPSYAHHKPTDQAYLRLPDGNGGRRLVYLGKYNSPESRSEYARIVAGLWEARVRGVPAPGVVRVPAVPGADVR